MYTVRDSNGHLIPRDHLPIRPLVTLQATIDGASTFASKYTLVSSVALYTLQSLLRIPLRRAVLIEDTVRIETELVRIVRTLPGKIRKLKLWKKINYKIYFTWCS